MLADMMVLHMISLAIACIEAEDAGCPHFQSSNQGAVDIQSGQFQSSGVWRSKTEDRTCLKNVSRNIFKPQSSIVPAGF